MLVAGWLTEAESCFDDGGLFVHGYIRDADAPVEYIAGATPDSVEEIETEVLVAVVMVAEQMRTALSKEAATIVEIDHVVLPGSSMKSSRPEKYRWLAGFQESPELFACSWPCNACATHRLSAPC